MGWLVAADSKRPLPVRSCVWLAFVDDLRIRNAIYCPSREEEGPMWCDVEWSCLVLASPREHSVGVLVRGASVTLRSRGPPGHPGLLGLRTAQSVSIPLQIHPSSFVFDINTTVASFTAQANSKTRVRAPMFNQDY